ncbi:glycosyltransferase family 2 protein [Sulfuriflexus mobilis]|uniref:glycosyltransferase family 2 protein n=1 Tax=Sulfuriflexus mobilis TaxID=1811807 RepID=UPI000F827C6E|nr:glycosyltransferase family 2 protein [Sulfuriflexus mobilis]
MAEKDENIMKVGLVIPVFNVEKTILKVMESIAQNLFEGISEILIIDNHSDDKTISIIRKYLHDNKELSDCVTLVLHAENYGYGCSIKAGFEYFLSRDVSHVMVIHGDYQVAPAWLMEKLIEPVKLSPLTDLVLASRFKSESSIENYSTLRKFGNYFFNITTRLCSGHKMSDSGTAMIIVRREILEKIPFLGLSNSWQFHPQLNILLYGLSGIRIQEVPMKWEDSDADSTVPLIRYGLILLRMLVLYWFRNTILNKNPENIFQIEPFPENRKFIIELQCSKY